MILPYKDSQAGKSQQVETMFDTIAGKYDFLNHFFSLGIDKIWRKRVCEFIETVPHEKVLDMASGTGDLTIAMAMQLETQEIRGIDLSAQMLEIGRQKIKKKKLSHIITLEQGNAEHLDIPDNTYDIVTCAFGVRNFENMEKGIQEIHRVLKPNGHFVILELSMPRNLFVKGTYHVYFRGVLPMLGKMFSKDIAAYTYLPKSVKHFPQSEKFLEILHEQGFRNCSSKMLNFGISTIFVGVK